MLYVVPGGCFNSTLVRFKQYLTCCVDRGLDNGFNSTLVRFKRDFWLRSPTSPVVSIPLWFDSNRKVIDAVSSWHWFQFHSGSIQTKWFPSNITDPGFGFNSTLVRFKPNSRSACPLGLSVSIPLWFDSNRMKMLEMFANVKFQFHSGSIQTQIVIFAHMIESTFQFHSGSIQTAHDWIDRGGMCRFQFHSGSIQTVSSSIFLATVESVSIPLWFDSSLLSPLQSR